jgi:[ribosomal protein S5]-alanine N-acetyltransferase
LKPEFWSMGYAHEAASAVLAEARDDVGLKRVLAITSPDNVASIALLGKLGFAFERMACLTEGAPEVRLFGAEL